MRLYSDDNRVVGAITHGGMNGIHEAVYAGKPLIIVPLFGEQTHNAKMAERANFGIVLEKSNFWSQKEIVRCLKLLLNDERLIV